MSRTRAPVTLTSAGAPAKTQRQDRTPPHRGGSAAPRAPHCGTAPRSHRSAASVLSEAAPSRRLARLTGSALSLRCYHKSAGPTGRKAASEQLPSAPAWWGGRHFLSGDYSENKAGGGAPW